jgi:hypothetical protein
MLIRNRRRITDWIHRMDDAKEMKTVTEPNDTPIPVGAGNERAELRKP